MAKFINIPEYWEEIKQNDFEYLLKLVYNSEPDKITINDVLKKFADRLLGEKQFFTLDKRTQYFKLVTEVAEKLEWIFVRDVDGNYQFAFETTENLIPDIDGYKGPQPHGNDLTFGEYRLAVDLMNKYTTERENFYLDALCGVLYRKPTKGWCNPGFDGNYREKFNKHQVQHYAENMKKVPEYLKWGIYVWFANFNRYLIEGGEFIMDGNTVSFESLFERSAIDEDTKPVTNIGLMSIVFTLADTGTFGNADKTDDTMLFPILLKLLHDKNAVDRLKKNDRN